MSEMRLRYEETGEVRPPQAGEWFRGNSGNPVRAQFDFDTTSFPILREVLEEESPLCSVIDRSWSKVLRVDQPEGVSLSWDALQALKDENLGKDVFAIEIYPPADEVINETNRRWLWVVPYGFESRLPSLYSSERGWPPGANK